MSHLPFRDLVAFARGGGWGSDSPLDDHEQVSIIRGTDFAAVRSSHVDGVPRRWEKRSKLAQRILRPGDVVLEVSGGSAARGQTTGRTLFIGEDVLSHFAGPVIPASFCRVVRFDTTIVEPRYAYYGLQDMYNSGRAGAYENQSTGISNFQFERFLDAELLWVPPLPEQQRIAAALRMLDDKIAVNDRIARTCRELGQTIFGSRVHRSRAAIQDVCAIVMGQSPPGESYNEAGDGLPFYQGTRDFGFHLPRRRVWSTAVTRHAATGDVLVSVRAPVGEVNVAAEPCGIGRGLAALRAHAYPHTLHHALRADSAAWSPFEGEGTVFSSINKKQLHTLEIRWPEPGDEARLEPDLRVLDERLIAALVENQSLEALRDTLLPELMSGRLRVRDAEKVVEDAV